MVEIVKVVLSGLFLITAHYMGHFIWFIIYDRILNWKSKHSVLQIFVNYDFGWDQENAYDSYFDEMCTALFFW